MALKAIEIPVIYYRISTIKNGEKSQSIELQKADVEKYIVKLGLDPAKVPVYCDIAKSGRSTKNRPEFNKMMAHAKEGKFDNIIVYKIDRFSRKSKTIVQLINQLGDMGIGFVATSQPFFDLGTNNPFRCTMLGMIADMAQLESQTISDRVKAGMAVKKKQGVKFGRKKVLSEELEHKILRLHYVKGNSIRKTSMMAEVGYGTAQKLCADNKAMGNEMIQMLTQLSDD